MKIDGVWQHDLSAHLLYDTSRPKLHTDARRLAQVVILNLGGDEVAYEQHIDVGLDSDLKERVAQNSIREGLLFGAVFQADLTPDEILALSGVGWTKRDYRDAPVMEPPYSTIDWLALKQRHRDNTLHAISHRLEEGAPWIGTRQEILEELISSQWEAQEDELRTLLHAFAFASLWNHEDTGAEHSIESQETFFFYTARMQGAAVQATDYASQSPASDSDFWDMVESLTN